jgi:hypothetical protein
MGPVRVCAGGEEQSSFSNCDGKRKLKVIDLARSSPSCPAFSSSTAPQAFPRPDRRMLKPARTGRVKAGGRSAAHTVRLGLDATEHDGHTVRSGFPPPPFAINIRHCRVHRSLRGRAWELRRTMVSGGSGAAMSLTRSADVAGGFARSPRPVPAGTTFHCERQ